MRPRLLDAASPGSDGLGRRFEQATPRPRRGSLGDLLCGGSRARDVQLFSTDQGVNARIVSPPLLPVVGGATYMVSFVTYFTDYGIGFIGLRVCAATAAATAPTPVTPVIGWSNQPDNFLRPNTYFFTAHANDTTATVKI